MRITSSGHFGRSSTTSATRCESSSKRYLRVVTGGVVYFMDRVFDASKPVLDLEGLGTGRRYRFKSAPYGHAVLSEVVSAPGEVRFAVGTLQARLVSGATGAALADVEVRLEEVLEGLYDRPAHKAEGPVAVPAVAVSVFQGGHEVYRHAAGLAHVESGVEAGADTRFRLYSTAKSLTAAAAFSQDSVLVPTNSMTL